MFGVSILQLSNFILRLPSFVLVRNYSFENQGMSYPLFPSKRGPINGIVHTPEKVTSVF